MSLKSIKKRLRTERLAGPGFTIVEMTVVVSIIIVLTTIALSFNRSSSRQLSLFKEQAIIIGLLNRAKALAAEKFNQDPNSCAFGLHFVTGSPDFVLFQDLKPADGVFGCKDNSGSFKSSLSYDNANGNESLENFSLDKNLSFEITQDGVLVSAGSSVDVLFVPPELTVTLTKNDIPVPLPLTLNIVDAISGGEAGVVLNATGQINTQ